MAIDDRSKESVAWSHRSNTMGVRAAVAHSHDPSILACRSPRARDFENSRIRCAAACFCGPSQTPLVTATNNFPALELPAI